jgi:hypothetical protein
MKKQTDISRFCLLNLLCSLFIGRFRKKKSNPNRITTNQNQIIIANNYPNQNESVPLGDRPVNGFD